MMDFTLMYIVTISLVLFNFSPSAYSDTYVNLTTILSGPGSPFRSFLSLIQTEKVIQTLEQQGNAEPGLTLFVPNDAAFARDNISWGTLSLAQVQALLLFHAIPQYFSATATDLSVLNQISPVLTMAGLQHNTDSGFTLNITYASLSDILYLNSGWTQAEVFGTMNITFFPTEIYQIDKVLMPEAIFGTNIPPPPSTSASSAPSASTTSTPHKNKSGNSPPLKSRTGLSGGVIAGISTGGVVGALLVAACIIRGFYFYRKTKVPDDLSSTKSDVEPHLETARARRSISEKSYSLGAPDTTSRRNEKLAKTTDYQAAVLAPVNVPGIGEPHWKSLLSNQPQGASDGDKNTNTGSGILIGDKSIGGGVNLELSDVHANFAIGNTTVNVYNQMLPTTGVGGDHLLTSH